MPDDEPDFVIALPEEVLDEHDRRIAENRERIGNLERFKYMAQGAILVIATIVGSGTLFTALLTVVGVL